MNRMALKSSDYPDLPATSGASGPTRGDLVAKVTGLRRRRPSLKGQMAWIIGDSLATLLAAVAVAFIAAKIIGPYQFGLAGAAYMIAQLAEACIGQPFSDALIQRKTYSNKARDTAFLLTLGVAVALTASMIAASSWIAALYGSEELTLLIIIQSSSCLLLATRVVSEAMLARKLRFRSLAIRNILAKCASAALIVVLAIGGYGALGVVIGNVIFSLLLTVLTVRAASSLPGLRYDKAEARAIAGFAIYSLLDGLIWTAIPRMFTFIVGYFQGVTTFGLLNLSFRINDAICALISALTSRIAYPIFSKVAAREPDRLLTAFVTGTRIVIIISMPVFFGLALVSGEIVALFLGKEWQDATVALSAVSLYSAASFSLLLSNPAIKAAGRPSLLVMIQLTSLTVVAAGAIGTGWLSFDAQLSVWIIFGPIYMMLVIIALSKVITITARTILLGLVRPSLASAIMLIGVYAISNAITIDSVEIKLIFKISLGMVLYAIAQSLIEGRFIGKLIANKL